MEANVLIVKRNEIWLANLGETEGSEQSGQHPVLIIQNDTGNLHAPTVIVAAITDGHKKDIRTHVYLKAGIFGMVKDSTIMLEQLRTIDKMRLVEKMGHLTPYKTHEADMALSISLALRG